MRQQAPLVAVLVLTVAVGAGVALATSGTSTQALFSAQGRPAHFVAPSPRASPSPTASPALSKAGQLSGDVSVVVGTDRAALSDASRAFVVDGPSATPLAVPAESQGVAVALKNLQRAVVGGATIQVTDDGGRTWRAPRARPPGPGPYVALLINVDDADVWFFAHAGRLLRTRDAGVSWRELAGLPNLQSPRMQSGPKTDQELLFDGTTVVLLDDNGNQVAVHGSLPGPAHSAAVIGGTVLAAAGDGRAYAYIGQSWIPVSGIPAGPMAGAGGHAWVGDGSGQLGAPARVSASEDGTTWTDATGLPDDQSVVAVGADRAGTVVVAYCAGGDVYRSTDAGVTFTRFSTALRS